MPYVRSKADRGKAAALVVAFHAALGLALVTGLAGETVRRASDSLPTFDVLSEPPEEKPPVATDSAAAPEDEAAAPNLRAAPAPIVASPPCVPLPSPSPLPVSEQNAPAQGSDPQPGAAAEAGPGTGAGGSGEGFGGGGTGGTGSGSGAGLGSEARLLSGNLTRRDYRRIRSFGSPRGQAVLGITVGRDGRLTGCMPIASSGNPDLDRELCTLLGRTRWAPALDRAGEPVSVALRYVATWDRD